MKTIKGNLILNEDTIFNTSLKVEGDIFGKDNGRYNLTIKGDLKCRDLDCWDLDCWDLDCRDLDCRDLKCWDLNCRDLNCRDLKCWDLKCWDLDCRDLSFFAVAIAFNSFKCKSWKSRRDNFVIKCLDKEIKVGE